MSLARSSSVRAAHAASIRRDGRTSYSTRSLPCLPSSGRSAALSVTTRQRALIFPRATTVRSRSPKVTVLFSPGGTVRLSSPPGTPMYGPSPVPPVPVALQPEGARSRAPGGMVTESLPWLDNVATIVSSSPNRTDGDLADSSTRRSPGCSPGGSSAETVSAQKRTAPLAGSHAIFLACLLMACRSLWAARAVWAVLWSGACKPRKIVRRVCHDMPSERAHASAKDATLLLVHDPVSAAFHTGLESASPSGGWHGQPEGCPCSGNLARLPMFRVGVEVGEPLGGRPRRG